VVDRVGSFFVRDVSCRWVSLQCEDVSKFEPVGRTLPRDHASIYISMLLVQVDVARSNHGDATCTDPVSWRGVTVS